MRISSSFRLASLLALSPLMGIILPASERGVEFQPLNTPPAKDSIPGKFIWADLFTTDPVAATKFYSGLLGWTANKITRDGQTYTVFSNGSRPVAGLAPRANASTKRASRWIGYISVPDINRTTELVKKSGGVIRAEARAFPLRGYQAIIADNEGSVLGLMQSTSGDSPDDEPMPGDWNWFELFAKDPQEASVFYKTVFSYVITLDLRTERKGDFMLSSSGLARAGIAALSEDADSKPSWLLVIRVEDIDETLLRTVKLGGEVVLAARPAAYESRFAIITDSTGGTLGLIEYVNNANPTERL